MQKIVFKDLSQEEQELLLMAREAASHFYNLNGTHYVGSALRTSDGKFFQGAAIRRQSASSSTCSERMTIDQAIFAGNKDYQTLALIAFNKDGSANEPVFPCGSCRQIIFEYYPEAKAGSILIANSDMSKIVRTDAHELLPSAYL